MKKILLSSILLISLFSFNKTVSTVYADNIIPDSIGGNGATYTLLEPLPCIEGAGQNCTNGKGVNGISYVEKVTISQYISYVFKLAIALAVFLATVMIIWGGFEYMLSAVPFVKVNAKERITNAIMGLAAALISYLVLQTIDPRLVQVNTTIPPICPPVKAAFGTGSDPKSTITVCDTAGTDTFTKSLQTAIQGEIDSLLEADKAKALQLQNDIADTQKSIDALTQLQKDGTITPEQEHNLEAFKLDVKSKDATLQKTFAETRGARNFSAALATLQNPSNYSLGYTHTSVTLASPQAISTLDTSNYNFSEMETYAKKMDLDGDHTGASEVRVRSQFYKDQVQEEQTLMQNVYAYQNFSGSSKEDARKKLQYNLSVYSQTEPATKGRVDAELTNEYQTIKKQRTDLINKTLSAPK
jgi:hypothetical protein